MTSSESMEMYLETIFLLENDHGHAHGVDIAKALNVSKASVSKATNQLKDKGLIKKENYGTITLTEEGKSIAKEVYQNHKIITRFLQASLGLTYDDAADNACRIEHVISDQMVTAIKTYLQQDSNPLR